MSVSRSVLFDEALSKSGVGTCGAKPCEYVALGDTIGLGIQMELALTALLIIAQGFRRDDAMDKK